jgi:hypothetical protein
MALDSADGYVAGDLDGGTDASLPIFNVERVQLQFNIAADFVAAQVANNVLIVALATGRILRIDLDNAADIDGTLQRRVVPEYVLTYPRRRPPPQAQRGWAHTEHVPGPFSITSHHLDYLRRELLSPHSVQTTQGTIPTEGRAYRMYSMEPILTHRVDTRDLDRGNRRQCL